MPSPCSIDLITGPVPGLWLTTWHHALRPPRGQGRVAGANYPPSTTPGALPLPSSLAVGKSLSPMEAAVRGLSWLDEEADSSSELAMLTTLPLPFHGGVLPAVVAACLWQWWTVFIDWPSLWLNSVLGGWCWLLWFSVNPRAQIRKRILKPQCCFQGNAVLLICCFLVGCKSTGVQIPSALPSLRLGLGSRTSWLDLTKKIWQSLVFQDIPNVRGNILL